MKREKIEEKFWENLGEKSKKIEEKAQRSQIFINTQGLLITQGRYFPKSKKKRTVCVY